MKNLIDRLNDFIEEKKAECAEKKRKKEISKLLEDAYSLLCENKEVLRESPYANKGNGKSFSTLNFASSVNDFSDDGELESRVYFDFQGSFEKVVFLFHRPEWEIWLKVRVGQYERKISLEEMTIKVEKDKDGNSKNLLSNGEETTDVPKEIVLEVEKNLKELVYEDLPDEIEKINKEAEKYVSDEIKRKFGLDKKEKKGNDDNNNGSDNDSSSSGDADRDAKKASD